jgi:hypothetical protein
MIVSSKDRPIEHVREVAKLVKGRDAALLRMPPLWQQAGNPTRHCRALGGGFKISYAIYA